MTDRDRLIELLFKVTKEKDCPQPCEVAEYLLANGVVVPPVEVGQTVWYIKGGYYRKTGLEASPKKVTEINQKWCGKILNWGFIADGTRYRFDSIGKTVFLTKEEAEEKLKEQNNG